MSANLGVGSAALVAITATTAGPARRGRILTTGTHCTKGEEDDLCRSITDLIMNFKLSNFYAKVVTDFQSGWRGDFYDKISLLRRTEQAAVLKR